MVGVEREGGMAGWKAVFGSGLWLVGVRGWLID